MPGKYKSKYGDEYESDDFEATDTLIGRNKVPTSPTKKKPRPVSATKKSPRRPVTPGKKKKRPQSAPSARSGHDLWMNAVKQRLTGPRVLARLYGKPFKRKKHRFKRKIVGLASGRNPQSPRHKTVNEFWIDTLRKTGTGITTASTGMNTFSGKRPRDKDMAYLSTPSYLRQMAGTEKSPKGSDPTLKSSPGTPAYKSQEEYYEQVLEYKKQVGMLNQEASNMKAKIRRLEEDSLKKEKEIDSLLNPQKSEELRRTLTDKRPDSGSVIHSLKQKILKLETQMRDKEAAYIKLQSDLKTTKVEEMKQQMEMFYNEIVRLQNSKDTGMDKSVRPAGKENNVKVKALNETILRLNKSNEQLQAENRSLKEDLKTAIDDNGAKSHRRDYEDMNKRDLLQTIYQLEKKLEKAERHLEGSSIVSYESRAPQVQGKIALDGSLEDRLDQLDKRESELLDLCEKKNEKIKQLTAEKNRWKKRCEEIEKLVGSGTGDHDFRTEEKVSRTSRPPSARTASSRGQRPSSARSDDRPPTARDRTPRGRSERPDSGRSEKRPISAKRRPSMESNISASRKQKIREFQENRSAKTIQRHWKAHHQDQQKAKERQKQSKNTTESVTSLSHHSVVGKENIPPLKLSQTKTSIKETKSPEIHLGGSLRNSIKPVSSVKHGIDESLHKDRSMSPLQLSGKSEASTGRVNGDESMSDDGVKLGESTARNAKIERFRENHAAKTIQHRWTGYQYKKHTRENEEAADLIRSALMGHTTRRQQMSRYHDDSEDDYVTEDEEYNECLNLIQSSLLGHQQRKSQMRNFHLSSAGEEDDDDDTDIIESPKRRLSSSQRSNRPPSPSIHRSRPQSGRSRSSISSAKGSSSFSSSYKGRGAYSSHLDDGDDDF